MSCLAGFPLRVRIEFWTAGAACYTSEMVVIHLGTWKVVPLYMLEGRPSVLGKKM